MRCIREPDTVLLAFTLRLRKSPDTIGDRLQKAVMTSHRLKCGPSPRNDVCRMAQEIREGSRKIRKRKERPAIHGTMDCGQKCFVLGWQCHQSLSEFLANGHLPQKSRQSANDKNDTGGCAQISRVKEKKGRKRGIHYF